jgi:hypothetical protein
MDEAVGLVEIHSFGHVRWDHAIMAEGFCHGINLDGECDRYSVATELPRETNYGRSTPTVAEQEDLSWPPGHFWSGTSLLITQLLQDCLTSLIDFAVLE